MLPLGNPCRLLLLDEILEERPRTERVGRRRRRRRRRGIWCSRGTGGSGKGEARGVARDRGEAGTEPGAGAGAPLLEPLFPPQPGASPGFAERVRQHKVRLEWVRAEPAGLRGAVRVLNLAYEKVVSVRYTLNGWGGAATYQPPGPPDGITDRFAFLLPLGAAATAAETTLEFAVRYRVAGAEYWDNNEGKNYRLRGRQRVPPVTGPPQDPDSSAWIHFI
ncbi:PREDICTED: protein phosphatase 1 regulatory subunit 3E-like [Ficedula albicollis]|uniref:protein phosphatase 1 regulatory subunit 3E-like n=1 Tax=Ficedula albicollis TaxID=59894 RepID=UPI0003596F3C|nr:PREDICTED: protein phosphatase 1 regulatory subunit 3E-like [Ficedula albicollis]